MANKFVTVKVLIDLWSGFDRFLMPLSFCTSLILELVSFRVRLESSFRSFSRPVLHAAARVIQEMGKSRAAAFSLGVDIDEGAYINTYSDNADSLDSDTNENSHPEGKSYFPS